MSGHSKWSKIKHQKATTDAKKGQIFSKLSRAITVVAKKGSDPEMNLELKYTIEQAKKVNMPLSNIERALKKAEGPQSEKLEEVQYEAFGPGGVAISIKGITDNKNRTTSEIKHFFSKHETKLAQPGSTTWALNQQVKVSESDREKLEKLIAELEEHEDVQNVISNKKP